VNNVFGSARSYAGWIDRETRGFSGDDLIDQIDTVYHYRKPTKTFLSHFNAHFAFKGKPVLRLADHDFMREIATHWLAVHIDRCVWKKMSNGKEIPLWNSYGFLYPWYDGK